MRFAVLVQLVIRLQLCHHAQEDDSMGRRLWRALVTTVVDNRPYVKVDFGKQLLGGESWIDVELSTEEFVIDAF